MPIFVSLIGKKLETYPQPPLKYRLYVQARNVQIRVKEGIHVLTFKGGEKTMGEKSGGLFLMVVALVVGVAVLLVVSNIFPTISQTITDGMTNIVDGAISNATDGGLID